MTCQRRRASLRGTQLHCKTTHIYSWPYNEAERDDTILCAVMLFCRIGPLGYAFVNFESVADAARAYDSLNNVVVPILTGTKQLKMRFKPAKVSLCPIFWKAELSICQICLSTWLSLHTYLVTALQQH